MKSTNNLTGLEIAVIGMAGRFPGAENIGQYWNNIKNGVESISFMSDSEIKELGITKDLLDNPNFVRCKGGEVQGKEYFDAAFFKYLPKEAEILFPHTRVFLECVWEAMEDAGYNADKYNGAIGLYAGASTSFLWEVLIEMSGIEGDMGKFTSFLLRNSDFLCSQTAYKMNFKGPVSFIQTACSTSLMAIDAACRSILTGESQIALAGGVYISMENSGYVYQEGMINSSDGHVRTFDKDASGAVSGEGAGVVVLKLLKKAISDGDNIHAIIKGTFSNNDGDEKVGYTAPGINGQAKAILSALRMAAVDPESIGYIEAHGTATALGDLSEIAALKLAFGTEKRQYCGIGSVKTNIGHLDTAAGVAGFIKAVLALKNKQLPPSLNFKTPNPKIDFENSPFFVNAELKEWKRQQFPRRAGVNSFGIGGTNVHVVLEEAQEPELSSAGRKYQLLLLSAKTATALDAMTRNMKEYLEANKNMDLADLCYTLKVGRKDFPYRRKILCENSDHAIAILSNPESREMRTNKVKVEKRPVVFMFSGLGSQYPEMCRNLYDDEPLFKPELDHCFAAIKEVAGIDLKEIIYHSGSAIADPAIFHQMDIAQYLVFSIGYSLGKLLMAWNIKPDLIIGYSFGEYITACISGVFSLEDAIKIIHKRGELIMSSPSGMMISVPLSRSEITPLLNHHLSLAIDNDAACIISGAENDIVSFEDEMREKRIMCFRLDSTHAVHSTLMAQAAEELKKYIHSIQLNNPKIPYISNVTGDWIKAHEATDPDYWAKQLQNTVEFAAGVNKILSDDKSVFIEIGAGSDISTLVNRLLDAKGITERAINLVRPALNKVSDSKYLINKLGQLWLYGLSIDWKNYYKEEKRHRLSLPTYPFERQKYWKPVEAFFARRKNNHAGKPKNISDWLYVPVWKKSYAVSGNLNTMSDFRVVLIFTDEYGVGDKLADSLSKQSIRIIFVRSGTSYLKVQDYHYQVNPGVYQDYEMLFSDLRMANCLPHRIFHLFSLSGHNDLTISRELLNDTLDSGYYSLLNIAQSLATLNVKSDIHLDVISNKVFDITGSEKIRPDKSTLLGPVKVIPQELLNIHCRLIDTDIYLHENITQQFINQLLNEFAGGMDRNSQNIICIRDNFVWIPDYDNKLFFPSDKDESRLREKGVYLITGGLGGIALNLAQHLAKAAKARVVLVGRSSFPAKSDWAQWLISHNSEDSTSEKIIQLQKIEESGGEVLICSADISDKAAMQKVVAMAEKQFGAVNGIIHTATVPDGALVAVRTREMSEEVFTSKLDGTLILDEIFIDRNLDFVVCFSSLSAFLGGFGQVAYCAANLFMDAFTAYKLKQNRGCFISINWSRWKNTGIAKITEKKHKELTKEELKGGLEIDEALDYFSKIVNYGRLPQVGVAEYDLPVAIAQSRQLQEIDVELKLSGDEVEETEAAKMLARPDLSSEYTPPTNELEVQMAAIWENFFGIKTIGITDNFFELGGDSLKSIVLLKRMKKDLNFDAGIKIFFSKPTIKQIAEEIHEVRSLLERKERRSKITI
jgi:acyl transferase domain-containing protein